MLGVGSTVAERYRLERVAGVGGFGVVYRAQDVETGALVAVAVQLATRIASALGCAHARGMLFER